MSCTHLEREKMKNKISLDVNSRSYKKKKISKVSKFLNKSNHSPNYHIYTCSLLRFIAEEAVTVCYWITTHVHTHTHTRTHTRTQKIKLVSCFNILFAIFYIFLVLLIHVRTYTHTYTPMITKEFFDIFTKYRQVPRMHLTTHERNTNYLRYVW